VSCESHFRPDGCLLIFERCLADDITNPQKSTCVISGIRIKYLPIVNFSPDIPWENLGITAWSVAEICLAIICACLPTFRHIYAGPAARKRFTTGGVRPSLRLRTTFHHHHKGQQASRDLQTPLEESVRDPFGSVSREHADLEKLSPRASVRPSTIDTGSDYTRTTPFQQLPSSRAQSQCDHHHHHPHHYHNGYGGYGVYGYEPSESPLTHLPERKPSRAGRARGGAPAPTSPCQSPEGPHRRPSVQSILDEIVVTQPPSAIIHEALGGNFPIRVAPGPGGNNNTTTTTTTNNNHNNNSNNVQQQPQTLETVAAEGRPGRFSSIDTVTGEGLSAPRPRVRRMASEGASGGGAGAAHTHYFPPPSGWWGPLAPPAAARTMACADHFNMVDFRAVGWAEHSSARSAPAYNNSSSNSNRDAAADYHAPRDFA
jgi:hypothetical protein